MNYLLKEVLASNRGVSSDLILTPSEEARICFECKKKSCSGRCKHYAVEKKKLKEKKSRN